MAYARNIALDARRTEAGDVRSRLTADALAELIGKSPATIRRWCRNGTIPHSKIGGEYVFDYVEVTEHFIRQSVFDSLERVISDVNVPRILRKNAERIASGLRDGTITFDQLGEINAAAKVETR